MEVSKDIDPTSTPWAQNGSYPPRQGNEIQIFIDGQAAYGEIAAAFRSAKQFIYLTISFGDQDFLLIPDVPESEKRLFSILRSRSNDGVDVRMVVWQPALHTPDTIPDPAPDNIPGVNDGTTRSIQARWDKAPGFNGRYTSVLNLFDPKFINFSAEFGCHHQKTYIMDDGNGGFVAFVGGINPVQTYWDTSDHDSLDVRRVEWKYPYPLKWLEKNPPLHDIFYRIKGPAVGDVLANFVERYNGASIPYANVTSYVVPPVTADKIPLVPDGIEVQVLRTIAPKTYPALPKGDQGIREHYLKALTAAGKGSLVYIENQYFFDHGIISEIHAAAERGAKIIALLTWKPDEGTFLGRVEKEWERISYLQEQSKMVEGHKNVALLTLGNSRPDPRTPGKFIYSETYIHSKTMAVFGPNWTVMTGGSANIAFTSMWFHSEMNIAFMDTALIKNWVAQLWSEHLRVSVDDAKELIEKPDDALTFFKAQADDNYNALKQGLVPKGRVYDWKSTQFPARDLAGINLDEVHLGGGSSQG
jgi:phosphatidylserine/phosphatidylglycerophosphate/cardiolipin synthase-like enzyme